MKTLPDENGESHGTRMTSCMVGDGPGASTPFVEESAFGEAPHFGAGWKQRLQRCHSFPVTLNQWGTGCGLTFGLMAFRFHFGAGPG